LQTDEVKPNLVCAETQTEPQNQDFSHSCRPVGKTKSAGTQSCPPHVNRSSCSSRLPWNQVETRGTQSRGKGTKGTATITPAAVHAATENPWSVLHTPTGTGTEDLEEDQLGSHGIELGQPPAPFRHVLRRFRRSRQFRRLLGLLAQPEDERGAAEGAEEDEEEEEEEDEEEEEALALSEAEEELIGPADAGETGCPICTTGNSPRVIPPASREAAGFPAQDHEDEEEVLEVQVEEEEASADAIVADADSAAAAVATAAALAAVSLEVRRLYEKYNRSRYWPDLYAGPQEWPPPPGYDSFHDFARVLFLLQGLGFR
jgi:hypothetical protein